MSKMCMRTSMPRTRYLPASASASCHPGCVDVDSALRLAKAAVARDGGAGT